MKPPRTKGKVENNNPPRSPSKSVFPPMFDMALENHNLKNPALKRTLQELTEMKDNPSDDFMSLPLDVPTYFNFSLSTFLISQNS
ncbi:E2 ubiquitin-conjugating enzyme [Sarracenia purpurea var. burkii]